MNLFRNAVWNLSDDEYVEKQRKTLRLIARFRWWLLAVGLVGVVTLVWMAVQIQQGFFDLSNLGEKPRVADLERAGFYLGAALGFGASWSTVFAIYWWFHVLTGYRPERLLVAHYKPEDPRHAELGDSLGEAAH